MRTKTLETMVGFFLLLGLTIICVMIVLFTQLGDMLSKTYRVSVSFPNASGLLKNSIVYFAGAPIGRVTKAPQVIDDGHAVEVELRINENAKVRNDAKFTIGSSGLLGDRYVDVQPRAKDAPYLKDGDMMKGERTPDFTEVVEKTEPLIANAGKMAVEAEAILAKINDEILTPETSKDLKTSIEKLRIGLGKINDKVLTDQATIDLSEIIKNLKSVSTRLDSLLGKAEKGQGALGLVLGDKKVAGDLAALVYNLRKKGVLFYSDVASEEAKDRVDGGKPSQDGSPAGGRSK